MQNQRECDVDQKSLTHTVLEVVPELRAGQFGQFVP